MVAIPHCRYCNEREARKQTNLLRTRLAGYARVTHGWVCRDYAACTIRVNARWERRIRTDAAFRAAVPSMCDVPTRQHILEHCAASAV